MAGEIGRIVFAHPDHGNGTVGEPLSSRFLGRETVTATPAAARSRSVVSIVSDSKFSDGATKTALESADSSSSATRSSIGYAFLASILVLPSCSRSGR
ncbi:hypothetical protein [Natrinema sp. H-ect4]|uniref:hypothetical protein n=1 Tax=Natrinema sp. H-ect4 TaxID=3242699 RepID=UPI0035A8BF7E